MSTGISCPSEMYQSEIRLIPLLAENQYLYERWSSRIIVLPQYFIETVDHVLKYLLL